MSSEQYDDLARELRQLVEGIREFNRRLAKALDEGKPGGSSFRSPESAVVGVAPERRNSLFSWVRSAVVSRAKGQLFRLLGYITFRLRRLLDWLDSEVLLPPWRLVVPAVVAIGAIVAGGGWWASPYWFPDPVAVDAAGENGDSLPVSRLWVARAAAGGAGLLLIVVSSPFWFRQARQLRPILVPGFFLLVILLGGGAAVLLAHTAKPSQLQTSYIVAIGAGMASVLTASVKWAFDMVGVHRENLRKRNEAMGNRVDTMINEHYALLLRRAREAREALSRLHRLTEFPERAAIAADVEVAAIGAGYRLGLFFHEEQRLYRKHGAIFLASQRAERRVARLLAVLHYVLGLAPEHEEELVVSVQRTENADDARRLSEFASSVDDSDSLRRLVGMITNRLEAPRILVGTAMALSEFRAQLLNGINEIHRNWYRDWEATRIPGEYWTREYETEKEWRSIVRQLKPLQEALSVPSASGPLGNPTDASDELTALVEEIENSIDEKDPVAIFAMHEERLEELLGGLLLRFRDKRQDIEPVVTSVLDRIGSKDESRSRYPLGWIVEERMDAYETGYRSEAPA